MGFWNFWRAFLKNFWNVLSGNVSYYSSSKNKPSIKNEPSINFLIGSHLSCKTRGESIIITGCNDAVSGELTIPQTYNNMIVRSIGENAFTSCKQLTAITMPDTITKIGVGAFANCTNLETINISNSVSSIEVGTFYQCISLTKIIIPDSVMSLEYKSFEGCIALKDIEISNNITNIGKEAFLSCPSLNSYPEVKKGDKYKVHELVAIINFQSLEHCNTKSEITIPQKITSIEWNVYCECLNLINITIPSKVRHIGVAVINEDLSPRVMTLLGPNNKSNKIIFPNSDITIRRKSEVQELGE